MIKAITDPYENDDPRRSLAGNSALPHGIVDAEITIMGGIPNGADERVWTVDELSERLRVSTKTISRWRRQGLVSFRFVCDGRKRVGFSESSVRRFVEDNPERVRRGAQFSQLTHFQRQQIIDRARTLAEAGGFPADIVKSLAHETARSAETIRYTLRQFDRDHPDSAVFPDHTGQLREETKQKIFRHYRRGDSLEDVAAKFCRTKASVRRIVAEMRAEQILKLPLDYMPNEQFARVQSEKQILAPVPASDRPARKVRAPKGLPQYMASLYAVPLLTRRQEVHLFRKMNYLKYKASKLAEALDPARPKARLMNQIERLYEESVATKNEIVRANLRLVVSIAKRHMSPSRNFFELVSDGNMALFRAVEKFDFARGFRFSTYSSWAIMKNFARSIPNEVRRQTRFRTSHDELFSATEDTRSDPREQESAQTEREVRVGELLDRLNERERKIIDLRFGLTSDRKALTLKQVGAEIGVTKERVRQLEVRAMRKLRKAAQDGKMEASGMLAGLLS
jgi:RNA polymerase primary sigma factor